MKSDELCHLMVLSVVCLQPVADPEIPAGPFIIEEVAQNEQASRNACYIPGLSRYFDESIQGRGYYVWIDIGMHYSSGQPYLTSGPFFPLPEDASEPIKLRIAPKYRQAFDKLLNTLVATSSVQRALVLCELNGNVTWPDMEQWQVDAVHTYGPVSIREFWALHDSGEILERSVTTIYL